jgi:hypothetical protein
LNFRRTLGLSHSRQKKNQYNATDHEIETADSADFADFEEVIGARLQGHL